MRQISAHHTGAVWGSAGLADRLGADITPAHAACARTDPEAFFPDQDDALAISAARGVCLGCPVRAQCLQLFGGLPHGIVAGLTAAERRAQRRGPHSAPPARRAA